MATLKFHQVSKPVFWNSLPKEPTKGKTLKFIQVSKQEYFKTAHQRAHQEYNIQMTPSL